MIQLLWRRLVPLLIVLLVVAGGGLRVSAAASDWSTPAEATFNSSTQANKGSKPKTKYGDEYNLCNISTGTEIDIFTNKSSAWAPVSGIQDPGAPERDYVRVEGQVFYGPDTAIAQGRGNPFITNHDAGPYHWSHDLNVFITPDKNSRKYLSDGNYNTLNYLANEWSTIELELENTAIPRFALPAPGDRITTWGNHIWDCGHGTPDHVRTEIHPPAGWVVYRQTASKSETPKIVPETQVNKKDQNPWRWYESTDLAGSAATLPTTGLRNTPVRATVADVFFTSFGGRIMQHLNGCHVHWGECYGRDTASMSNTYPQTPNAWQWFNDILQQDYSFFVPAPPRPAGAQNAALVWELEDRCSEVPKSPANYPWDEGMDQAVPGDGYQIGTASCPITEQISETVDSYGQPGVLVTLKAKGKTYPDNRYAAYAKRIKLAWDYTTIQQDQRARSYKVDLKTLLVAHNADECYEAAQWFLYTRINEHWILPINGKGHEDKAFWEWQAIHDGRECFHIDPPKEYAINEQHTVLLYPNQPLRLWATGWDDEFFNNKQILPAAVNNNVPLSGMHFLGKPLSTEVQGSYQIKYSVTETTPPLPISTKSPVVGKPHLWLNKDTLKPENPTLDFYRVSAITPLTVPQAATNQVQYRVSKWGQAPGKTWITFTGAPGKQLPFSLGSLPGDGIYVMEYAHISDKGIVGERKKITFQLDASAPKISMVTGVKQLGSGQLVGVLSTTLTVTATSAAGAEVDFKPVASDSLPTYNGVAVPGPVTLSCEKPAGKQLFPIGTNFVVCTATDSVGNKRTQALAIKVVSPVPVSNATSFVLLGENWLRVKENVKIKGGHIGVRLSSGGVPDKANVELRLSSGVTLTGGIVAAETVQLGDNVKVGDVHSVSPVIKGSNVSFTPRPGIVPLFGPQFTLPSATPANSTLKVTGDQTLPPGVYGTVVVTNGAQLTLGGGSYTFKSLEIWKQSQVLYNGGAAFNITDKLALGYKCKLIPKPGSGYSAANLRIYVLSSKQGTNSPAVKLGEQSEVGGTIVAPNGTVLIQKKASFTGAAFAHSIYVEPDAAITFDINDAVFPD